MQYKILNLNSFDVFVNKKRKSDNFFMSFISETNHNPKLSFEEFAIDSLRWFLNILNLSETISTYQQKNYTILFVFLIK